MKDKEKTNRHKYDKASKYLLDEFSTDLIEFFAGIKGQDIQVLDKEQNLPVKKVDSAYKINNQFILNIEVQTKFDESLPFRIALYSMLLKNRYELPVKSYAIHLTPESAERITDNYHDEFEGCTTNYKYHLVKLWEFKPEDAISKELYGIYPLVPLMKKDENLLKICNDKIVQSNLGEKVKKDLLGSLESLAGLFYKKEVIKEMLSYDKLKDSVTVQAWVTQGRKEGEKNAIIQFLNDRFPKIPKNILKAISEIEDENFIDDIIKKVFKVNSLDEVKKLLKNK